MSLLGHNKGPTMEKGAGWRRHCWTKARADLLPKLPLEIVRLRVRRARELGLDYKSYAGIRATTGRDVVAFLFSSNALRITPDAAKMPLDRAEVVSAIKSCERLAVVHAPLDPAKVAMENPQLDSVETAPSFVDSWSVMRDKIKAVTSGHGLPGDGVVVIGDTAMEREWTAAGKLAGFISSDQYFGDRV
jgi:hypothetical protein